MDVCVCVCVHGAVLGIRRCKMQLEQRERETVPCFLRGVLLWLLFQPVMVGIGTKDRD